MGLFEQLPYTNFHDLNLTELVKFVNETIKHIHEMDLTINEQNQAIEDFKEYVLDYLNNLNVDQMVKDYIDELIDQGTLNVALPINISNFSTRKVVCVSDSYGLMPTLNSSWIHYLKQFLNIGNANFFRTQYSGSGFCGVDSSHKFIDILTTLAATMTDDDKTHITDIVVCGGYNDAYAYQNGIVTASGLRTLINDFVTYCHNTFPNARIYISDVSWGNHYDRHKWLRLVDMIYRDATINNYHVAYIDGVDWMHKTSLRDSSGFHPVEDCSKLIAQSLASVLLGGKVNCDLLPDNYGFIVPSFSRDTSTTGGFSWGLPKQLYTNGMCTFTWANMQFILNASLAHGNTIHLGDFVETIMTGGDTTDDSYIGNVLVQDNNDGHYKHCILYLYNNGLYLKNISTETISTSLCTIQPSTIVGSCML